MHAAAAAAATVATLRERIDLVEEDHRRAHLSARVEDGAEPLLGLTVVFGNDRLERQRYKRSLQLGSEDARCARLAAARRACEQDRLRMGRHGRAARALHHLLVDLRMQER